MPFTQAEQKVQATHTSALPGDPVFHFQGVRSAQVLLPEGSFGHAPLAHNFASSKNFLSFVLNPQVKRFQNKMDTAHPKLHRINRKTLGHLHSYHRSPGSQVQNQHRNIGFSTRKAEARGLPEIEASEFRVSLGYSDLVLKRGKQKTKTEPKLAPRLGHVNLIQDLTYSSTRPTKSWHGLRLCLSCSWHSHKVCELNSVHQHAKL